MIYLRKIVLNTPPHPPPPGLASDIASEAGSMPEDAQDSLGPNIRVEVIPGDVRPFDVASMGGRL